MTSRFAVIVAGLVQNVILADANTPTAPGETWVDIDAVNPQPGPGWMYNGSAFAAPVPTTVAPPPYITVYAFKNRFTQAERVAIRTAAATVAAVADYLDMVASRNYVDLSDPTTTADVNALVTASLLTSARAAAILSLTIQPQEYA